MFGLRKVSHYKVPSSVDLISSDPQASIYKFTGSIYNDTQINNMEDIIVFLSEMEIIYSIVFSCL